MGKSATVNQGTQTPSPSPDPLGLYHLSDVGIPWLCELLVTAARDNDVERTRFVARALVALGVGVDRPVWHGSDNYTAVQAAIWHGNYAVLEVLVVEYHSDVFSRGETGKTPLCMAAEKGQPCMVHLLVAHRATPQWDWNFRWCAINRYREAIDSGLREWSKRLAGVLREALVAHVMEEGVCGLIASYLVHTPETWILSSGRDGLRMRRWLAKHALLCF